MIIQQKVPKQVIPNASDVGPSKTMHLQPIHDHVDKNKLDSDCVLLKVEKPATVGSNEMRCNSASVKRSQSLSEASDLSRCPLVVSQRSLLRLKRKQSVDALQESGTEGNTAVLCDTIAEDICADGSQLPSAEDYSSAQMQSKIPADFQLQMNSHLQRLALYAGVQPVHSVETSATTQLPLHTQLHLQSSVIPQVPTDVKMQHLAQHANVQLSQQTPSILPGLFAPRPTLPFQSEILQAQSTEAQVDAMVELLSRLQAQKTVPPNLASLEQVLSNLSRSTVQTSAPLPMQVPVQTEASQSSQIHFQPRLPLQTAISSSQATHLPFHASQPPSTDSQFQDQTHVTPQNSPPLRHEAELHIRVPHNPQAHAMMLGQLPAEVQSFVLQHLPSVNLLQQPAPLPTNLPLSSGHQAVVVESATSGVSLNESQVAWLYAQYLEKALSEAPSVGSNVQPFSQSSLQSEMETGQFDEYLFQLKQQQQQQLSSGIPTQPSNISLYPSDEQKQAGAADLSTDAVVPPVLPLPQTLGLHPVGNSLPTQIPSNHPSTAT